MIVISAKGASFRIVPEKWKEINDKDITRMFDSFIDFFICHEEYMTLSEAEKARDIMCKWKTHLKNRNIDTSKYNWI